MVVSSIDKEVLKIDIISTKEIDGNSISVLNITINVDGKEIYLGEFYIEYIEEVNDELYYYIYDKLMNNADNIIFENNRYIGDELEMIDKIRTCSVNENLKEIYLEFLSFSKHSKEYKKYSRFLELYFHSHNIPDEIRKEYLDANDSSILDYSDLDHEIKKDFLGSMDDLVEQTEHQLVLQTLDDLKNNNLVLREELLLIEKIIISIEELLSIKQKNYKIMKSVRELELELSNMNIFNKNRKCVKKRLKDFHSSYVKIDMEDERKKIKDLFLEYASLYKDATGLSVLFDNLSLGDILYILKDIYSKKKEILDVSLEKEERLINKVSKYSDNTIDISDLYERLEESKIKK